MIFLWKQGLRGREDTGVVKFPIDLILKSIQNSRKKHVLYGRDFDRRAQFGYSNQMFMSSAGQYLLMDEKKKKCPAILEDLRRKPMVEAFVEPISPLQLSKEGLKILIEFAKAGLPFSFGLMAIATATVSATLAGTIAQENAGILAGIVMSQIYFFRLTYYLLGHSSYNGSSYGKYIFRIF